MRKRRVKTALLLFLVCLPGKVFFSEQQTASNAYSSCMCDFPSSHISATMQVDKTSQLFFSPVFVIHLLLMMVLFLLFILSLLDLMFKAVFYGCTIGLYCCTEWGLQQRGGSTSKLRMMTGAQNKHKKRLGNDVVFVIHITGLP